MFKTGRKLTTLLLFVAAATVSRGQAANEQLSAPNIAARIAKDIDSHTLKSPGAEYALESAQARYNMVELHYIARTPVAFAAIKAVFENQKLAKVRYYCDPARIKALQAGVVFREVLSNGDHSEQLGFVVDLASCARAVVAEPPTDAKALAQLARAAARAESANFAGPSGLGIRLDDVTNLTDEVDERFVVDTETNPTLVGQRLDHLKAVLAGFYCASYADFIHRGLAFHPTFVSSDSTVLFDFKIDKSKC